MTDAIEGRWWLELTHRRPTDLRGTELLLGAGEVTSRFTRNPFGTYQIEPGLLTIMLRLPVMPDEGQRRIEAKLTLLDFRRPAI